MLDLAKPRNVCLMAGGILSSIAALLHLAIIAGGADWYRFFGAGEKLASMAASGSAVPGLITFGIALVLLVWGLYAFSGAGMIRRVPFLRVGLVLISLVYLGRGLVAVPVYFLMPDKIDSFAIWSSMVCVGFGLFYAVGTRQSWRRLGG